MDLIPRFALWPIAREVSRIVPDIWVQHRFANNQAINEVDGSVATLYGAATVTDNRLVSNPASPSNYASFNSFFFEDNEDFCISLNVNMPFTESRLYNTIIGTFTVGAGPSAWVLGRTGTEATRRKMHFLAMKNGVRHDFYSVSDLSPNVDYHLEVSRTDNVLYMFINGQLDATFEFSSGTDVINLPSMRTDVIHAEGQTSTQTHMGGGLKWDIQLKKGEGGHTANFTPEPLTAYKRAEYSTDTETDVRLQLGFRSGSKACEVTGKALQTFGTASVNARGRLVQTNAVSSYATIPVSYFGAADFTIEFMCNISALSSNGLRIGHWISGASGTNARYGLHIDPSRFLAFAIQNTESAGDYEGITSAAGVFPLNRDNHIIIERKDGIVSIVVNREVVATGAILLPIRDASTFRTNGYSGTDSCAGSFWNIRIADRAMYSGSYKTKPIYPGPSTIPISQENLLVLHRFNGSIEGEGPNVQPVANYGTPTFSNDVPEGWPVNRQSLYLNGSSGVWASNGPVHGPITFTATVKIKPSAAIAGNYAYIMSQRDAQNNGQWALFMFEGKLAFYEYPAGVTATGLYTDTLLTNDEWQQVTVVRSASKVVSLYVDDLLVGQRTVGTVNNTQLSNGFAFGHDARDRRQFFIGNMCDALVFGRELSVQEIALLSNTSKPFPELA